jgi:hypothetical protein
MALMGRGLPQNGPGRLGQIISGVGPVLRRRAIERHA